MKKITVSFLLLLLLLAGSYINAWTKPTAQAPAGNVAAPVNTGTVTQQKNGNLIANIYAAFIEMRSDRYCDLQGNNCILMQKCQPGQTLIADATGTMVCGDIPKATSTPSTKQVLKSFHTQYAALIRDPAFLAWGVPEGLKAYAGGRCGTGTQPGAGLNTYRCEHGWYHPSNAAANKQTFDKICSYMMVNGSYAAGAVLADYGSDNGNNTDNWSKANNKWSIFPHGSNGAVDAVQLTCIGDSVSTQGQFWLTSTHPNPVCSISRAPNGGMPCGSSGCTGPQTPTITNTSWSSSRYRCNPFPIPPMR